MAKTEYSMGTGKRKTSVARVYLKAGKGDFVVNQRTFDSYFPIEYLKSLAMEPLEVAKLGESMDIRVTVRGGGYKGQLFAIRHGIARALVNYDGELRGVLKKQGLLTRDARKKERKKYGQKGARARFQFSKR